MVKHSIAFSLLTLVCLTATAHAEHPQFCDPVAIQLQNQCECGTLLPYHFALDRAEDATRAEAKVTQLTEERNELQTQLVNLQKQLQQVIAERTKAEIERDQARDEALTAAKVAREQQDQALAARQATEVANKAKQQAEEIAAKAIAEVTQIKTESTQQVAVGTGTQSRR